MHCVERRSWYTTHENWIDHWCRGGKEKKTLTLIIVTATSIIHAQPLSFSSRDVTSTMMDIQAGSPSESHESTARGFLFFFVPFRSWWQTANLTCRLNTRWDWTDDKIPLWHGLVLGTCEHTEISRVVYDPIRMRRNWAVLRDLEVNTVPSFLSSCPELRIFCQTCRISALFTVPCIHNCACG